MDPWKFTTAAHRLREICSPINAERLMHELQVFEGVSGRVVDIGCGKGFALSALAKMYGIQGVGVELNPFFVDDAQSRFVRDGVGDLVSVELRDANELLLEDATYAGALCLGASDAFGSFGGTLRAMHTLVESDGVILVGDSYWIEPPPREYLEFLGGEEHEVLSNEGNTELARATGFELIRASTSSDEDRQAYESDYARGVATYVRENPNDPDVHEMENRIAAWWEAYEKWGKRCIGFGWYALRAKK